MADRMCTTAPLGSMMYAFSDVPALLRGKMYAFLRVQARLGSRIYGFLCAGAPSEPDVCILRVPAPLATGCYVFMCASAPGEQDVCICTCAGAPGGAGCCVFLCAGDLGLRDVYIFACAGTIFYACLQLATPPGQHVLSTFACFWTLRATSSILFTCSQNPGAPSSMHFYLLLNPSGHHLLHISTCSLAPGAASSIHVCLLPDPWGNIFYAFLPASETLGSIFYTFLFASSLHASRPLGQHLLSISDCFRAPVAASSIHVDLLSNPWASIL